MGHTHTHNVHNATINLVLSKYSYNINVGGKMLSILYAKVRIIAEVIDKYGLIN